MHSRKINVQKADFDRVIHRDTIYRLHFHHESICHNLTEIGSGNWTQDIALYLEE